MELALALAVALLSLGVVGSVVPLVPGALVSLVGVYGYWWSTGYAEPGPAFLVGVTVLAVAGVVADLLAGAVAARVGGASTRTAALAAVASLVLLVFLGPLGILVGVAGTVFAAEYHRTDDADVALRSSLYTTVGMLASTVVQLGITVAILLAFVVAVLL